MTLFDHAPLADRIARLAVLAKGYRGFEPDGLEQQRLNVLCGEIAELLVGASVEPEVRGLDVAYSAIRDGAIPAMRWAAHRLRALGESEAEVAKLFDDADKLEAALKEGGEA